MTITPVTPEVASSSLVGPATQKPRESAKNRSIRAIHALGPSASYCVTSGQFGSERTATAGKPAGKWRPSDLQLAAGAGALILAAIAWAGFDLQATDFRSFYESGGAWRGLPVDAAWRVSRPDLNPPTFSLLMIPFSYLPLAASFVLWTVLSLVSLVASLRLISAHVELDRDAWTWLAIALVGFMPCLHVLVEGQLVYLLLYPMTRAWLARSDLVAGLWLIPVIAVKPPLAVVALLLPWRVWTVAGIGSALVTLNVVGLVGLEPWRTWLELSGAVRWLATPSNLSIFGAAARLEHGALSRVGVSDLSAGWWLLVLVVAAVGAWTTVRTTSQRRWVLAVLVAELVSPLGWIYYLPLALGPALASWPSGRPVRVAMALLAVPMPVLAAIVRLAPAWAVPVASVYFVGMLVAWYAWTRRPPPADLSICRELADGPSLGRTADEL